MTRRTFVRHAESSDDLEAVRQLCWDYRDFLLSYGEEQRRITEAFYQRDAYAALMDNLTEKHARPSGAILLVEDNNGAVQGCGMIQGLGGTNAEIKRVFIRPEARGAGAGRDLTRALISQARADGHTLLLLDTSRAFKAARALYEAHGFVERGPYCPVPADLIPLLRFYELDLTKRDGL
jgi:GNAT superfamily N-acetyltransferase